jgi:hypothetical protein
MPHQALFLASSKFAPEPAAAGRSIPTFWNGKVQSLPSGYDTAKEGAVQQFRANASRNTLLGLSVTVLPRYQGQGLSNIAVRAMKEIAAKHSLEHLVVPIRPNLKAKYPQTSIEDNASWRNSKGAVFDPWLRTHLRTEQGCSGYPRQVRYVWTLCSTSDKESDNRLVRRRSRTFAEVWAEFQYRAADVSTCGAALAGVGREGDCLDAMGGLPDLLYQFGC